MKITDLIGNTPIVKVSSEKIKNKKNVEIWAKLENMNPTCSVKDRAAYAMIKTALDNGTIDKNTHLIEATSGNTGIALAMICAAYRLKITLLMPESATEERKKMMRAFGAKLILTPADKTIEYSRTLAEEMAKENDYYLINQFANMANPNMHYNTTGPELWKDTKGKITHFVSAMGTTGTIMGVSQYLKEKNNSIQIIGAQPTEGSKIPGIRKWSPRFLPKIFEPTRVDRIINVSDTEATEQARVLAKQEGICAGMSSGGAYKVALTVASEIDEGIIVFIVCDIGDRYLSSTLFDISTH